MKDIATKHFTAKSVLSNLVKRCFARPPSQARAVKRVSKVSPARSMARPAAVSPVAMRATARKSATALKKEPEATQGATTARKTKMKNDRVPLFADLLDDKGSRPMRVEGFEHRTRDGGYIAATRRQVDVGAQPMRVEGWGHRKRDGRKLP
jgi:hypothetical protein